MINKTRNYVYLAFYAALAVALSYATEFLPSMPNGGTLDLPVIAIFVASFHLGWKYGMAAGLLSWVVGMLFGLSNYIVSPLQTLFDYIIPVLAPGIASAFPSFRFKRLYISNIYIGIFAGMFLKYFSHTLAGVFFWFPEGSAAGSATAWFFSGVTYNLPYNALTLVASLVVVPILIAALQKSSGQQFIGIRMNPNKVEESSELH